MIDMRSKARKQAATALAAIALGLLLLYPWSAEAQAGEEVSISFEAGRRELTVGDVATLTLGVTYPIGSQVILPRLPGTWGPFEVRSQSPIDTTANGDGTETVSRTIDVALFAPGEFETPELTITVRDPAGRVHERPAPRVLLEVTSVLAEDDVELRDIRPQAGLPLPPLWPWALGAAVLASAVGFGLYLLARRRGLGEPGPIPVIDPRSPYEVARDELDRIATLGLSRQHRFKEHYSLVSDCVRRYLQDGHNVPSVDHTTAEIRTALRGSSIPTDHSRSIVDLLSAGDLVKFAKHVPEVADAQSGTVEASRLVEATRPEPEPVAMEAGHPAPATGAP